MLWVLVLIGFQVSGQTVVRDLKGDWLEYDVEGYRHVGDQGPSRHTIYFTVDAAKYKGQQLSISSRTEWHLLIDGKLIFSGWKGSFDLDSLSSRYSPSLFCGIHTEEDFYHLETLIVSRATVPPIAVSLERPITHFSDFCILVSAVLALFFLLLLRNNPQLTIDYFSFTKIFSVKERNETLLASRIGSSVNLLFYLLSALFAGFLLTIVFHFAGDYFTVAGSFPTSAFSEALFTWLKLSFFILILLGAKLLIVLAFSSLFNFRETVSFQFFNFLRFVLFTSVAMAALDMGYFLFRGEQPGFFKFLIVMALMLMSVGPIMVMIKLLPRASFSLFHLFSYLCASEIIPLVIIIKIFF